MSFQNTMRVLTVFSGLAGIAAAQPPSSTKKIEAPNLNYSSRWKFDPNYQYSSPVFANSGNRACFFVGPKGQEASEHMETNPGLHNKGDWMIAQDVKGKNGTTRRVMTFENGQYIITNYDTEMPRHTIEKNAVEQDAIALYEKEEKEAEKEKGTSGPSIKNPASSTENDALKLYEKAIESDQETSGSFLRVNSREATSDEVKKGEKAAVRMDRACSKELAKPAVK